MTWVASTRAIVTGGASGLGKAIALEIIRRNGAVMVADISLDAAEATAKEIAGGGGKAFATRCDVSKLEEVEAAFDAAEHALGGVDLIVNNAGVAVTGPIGVVPMADWNWILGINLNGVIHGCHVAVPRFLANGHGHILNVASAAGLVSSPLMGPYNVTKAAVVALSETLHQELLATGVGITVLCPTFFVTGIVDSARTHGNKDTNAVARVLMKQSKIQAPDVARAAIDGCTRNQLYVVPMTDGRWLWRFKRLAPALFYGRLSPWAYTKLIPKLLPREGK